MKSYEAAGLQDFVVCCGYKSHMIKKYFVDYFTESCDITVDLGRNSVAFHGRPAEKWVVTLVDTGIDTMTGGRIKRIAPHLAGETFCLTYGDGLADLDIRAALSFHRQHGRAATVTATPSPGRFGILDLGEHDSVAGFREKPDGEMGWINGGFFVCEPEVLDYIAGDDTYWETEPLQRLAAEGKLMAFRHTGFWKPMDTPRDRRELEALWAGGQAPWKKW
jgi:glucose-1-phosphate cytidylyltransferase